jgi:hypothetical protein
MKQKFPSVDEVLAAIPPSPVKDGPSGVMGPKQLAALEASIMFPDEDQVRSCGDFEDEPGFPGCCPTCHSDEDYGEEKYSPDRGINYRVCCTVASWLGKHRYRV